MLTDLTNLAAARLGTIVLEANDDFFAPKENLIHVSPPVWREGEYTDRGKWMDGWETRRRRTPGHDWAIIQLGAPGIVHGFVIDTAFFTGNFPERASVDGCDAFRGTDTEWITLLPETALTGNALNTFESTATDQRITHVRLNIFPDGGVARFRVHGEVVPDESLFAAGVDVDLAAMINGGHVILCSDMHYGNRQNLILPGRSTHMGDGWETRRRRGPGHDWTIVRLARRGVVDRVELDTDHFKGNAPGSCMLESCDVAGDFDPDHAIWHPLVAATPVNADARHVWPAALSRAATHVRLNIYPDGGVARLRLFGRAAGISA